MEQSEFEQIGEVALKKLELDLQASGPKENIVAFVQLLAKSIFSMKQLDPMLLQHLANYIAKRSDRPSLEFAEGEQLPLESQAQLCLYFAKKARRRLFNRQNQLLELVGGSPMNGVYADSEGNKITIQWDELCRQEASWRRPPF